MTPAENLDRYREQYGKPPRLGCSLVAHRDLGWCNACLPPGYGQQELSGWRLLAMAERGIPHQPSEPAALPSPVTPNPTEQR